MHRHTNSTLLPHNPTPPSKHCSTSVSLMLSQEHTIHLKELEYFQKFYFLFRNFLRMFITLFLIINSTWGKIKIVWFFFNHLQWCNTGLKDWPSENKNKIEITLNYVNNFQKLYLTLSNRKSEIILFEKRIYWNNFP